MKLVKEQELLQYVVATIDQTGTTLYLKSLHEGRYQLVEDISYATKLVNKATAKMFYEIACSDFPRIELVLLPVKITYELINELEDVDNETD